MFQYQSFNILEVAGLCGIRLDSRTLGRSEVQGWCPFCSSESTSYHLHLNPQKEKFYCHKCSAKGNSVTMYARIFGISNYEASKRLSEGGSHIAPAREQTSPKVVQHDPAPIQRRHDVYYTMLEKMPLLPKHRQNLMNRGLSRERIDRNLYRSLPENRHRRNEIARELAKWFDLRGIPGFFYPDGKWALCGKPGILIPVLNPDGYIQGLQIRLDDVAAGKYRWLSSNPEYGFAYGTPSSTWVHVTGDRDATEVFITEGGLKGDIASYLSGDQLFVCTAGATSLRYLRETVQTLDATKLSGCFDMDKVAELAALEQIRWDDPSNVHAQKPCPLERMEAVVDDLGLPYQRRVWPVAYNGIDDYYLAQLLENRQKAA